MKKSIIVTLLSSAVLLASCGGPDLGKKVSQADFEAHVKAFEEAEKPDVAKVTTKGSLDSNVPGSEHKFDLNLVIDAEKEPETEAEIYAMTLIEMVDVDYVFNYYKSFPEANLKKEYYYNEGNKCTSIVVNVDYEQSAMGISVSNKLEGKYSWNEFGYLVYAFEDQTIKMSAGGEKEEVTVKLDFEVSYEYAVAA